MTLTKDDLAHVNHSRSGWMSFGITSLDISVMSDDEAHNLENFINNNGIDVDMFNIEYMGYLTGQVKVSDIEEIIPIINEFFLMNKK